MGSDEADLYFGQTHRPEGFTSAAVAQFDGSAEPVVRELIQNSLDAANQAEIPVAEVRFLISEAARDELPGWISYKEAFEAACEQRSSDSASQDERMVIKRIRSASSLATIPLLLCIDNGHGLNGTRMDALLTPGNTSKGERGAGSFGLGHHAAFGASDLRYVLYGAKYRSDAEIVSQISSGHAILASHRDSNSILRAADGYWFKLGQGNLAFDGTDSCYPDSLPSQLWEFLADVETGTVVCVAGFNDFRRERDDPTAIQSICRVAASNFCDAIHSGSLIVRVEDDCKDARETIDRDSLQSILERYSNNRRAIKQGQINGNLAYNAWQTIEKGSQFCCNGGGTVRWRHLNPSIGEKTRIHVFRKGMWITSHAPHLDSSVFSSTRPFDAVLSLSSGPLEGLIRSAEGPEHRGIDRKRLDNDQNKQYREIMSEVARELRSIVGERQDLEDFVPDGFAALIGHEVRTAERLRRPRMPSGGGKAGVPVMGGQRPGDATTPRTRHNGSPRPGSRPQYRTSLRILEPYILEAHMEYEEEVGPQTELGVRMRLVSGSDATCEHPLADDFLQITSVRDDTGASAEARNPSGDLELLLPAVSGRRRLTIVFASPIIDLHLLELDLVKRKLHSPDEDRQTAGQVR